jgi:N-acetyl-anhydromuramyl-L-alanine amidase AmpD
MLIPIDKLSTRKVIDKIVLHHSATPSGNAEIFDKYHRETNGWACIGYHYVICNGNGGADGLIEYGRPLQFQGAHCKNNNLTSIGICVIGDFTTKNPTTKQMESLDRLVKTLKLAFKDIAVYFHRDLANSSCPGDSGAAAFQYLK